MDYDIETNKTDYQREKEAHAKRLGDRLNGVGYPY